MLSCAITPYLQQALEPGMVVMWRLPHVLNYRVIVGGEAVNLMCSPSPPGRSLVLISVGGLAIPRAAVRLKGLGLLKSSLSYWEFKLALSATEPVWMPCIIESSLLVLGIEPISLTHLVCS
jgi:hypothetical protein